MRTENCTRCHWFEAESGQEINQAINGCCHFNPPTVTTDGKSHFAEVFDGDFCARFFLAIGRIK